MHAEKVREKELEMEEEEEVLPPAAAPSKHTTRIQTAFFRASFLPSSNEDLGSFKEIVHMQDHTHSLTHSCTTQSSVSTPQNTVRVQRALNMSELRIAFRPPRGGSTCKIHLLHPSHSILAHDGACSCSCSCVCAFGRMLRGFWRAG